MTDRDQKPIWVKWTVHDDGRVEVVATYGHGGAFVQREAHYDSLDQAVGALGSGFRDVVTRAIEVGSYSGRWRP
jgi:hypothetical protein